MTVASGIESKAYHSRPATLDDMPAVVGLYNFITGRNRTLAQHLWEWWETPEGPGSMWVIEEALTGEIVGHHGLIPLRLQVGDLSVLAGKTENTMVHPDHRSKVLYFLHEKQFARAAEDRFDLLFTTSGYGTPGRIRRKLGYQSAGTITFYIKATRGAGLSQLAAPVAGTLTSSRIVNRSLALAVNWASRPAALAFAAAAARPAPDIQVTRCTWQAAIGDQVEALWRRSAPALGITIERSAAYIQWRLATNPNVAHIYFAAWRGGDLAGFAAIEPLADSQALIVDLFAENNDPQIFDSLLQGVTRQLDAEGVHIFVLQTMQGNGELGRALRRNGFYDLAPVLQRLYRKASREQPEFLVKAIDPALRAQGLFDASRWYYTALFAEGLSTGSIGLRRPKSGEES